MRPDEVEAPAVVVARTGYTVMDPTTCPTALLTVVSATADAADTLEETLPDSLLPVPPLASLVPEAGVGLSIVAVSG